MQKPRRNYTFQPALQYLRLHFQNVLVVYVLGVIASIVQGPVKPNDNSLAQYNLTRLFFRKLHVVRFFSRAMMFVGVLLQSHRGFADKTRLPIYLVELKVEFFKLIFGWLGFFVPNSITYQKLEYF